METSRVQLLTAAVTISMIIDEEDLVVINGMRRRHRYWVSPYLRARTDSGQRNTLAKLERDFLRLGCTDEFQRTTRMPPEIYKELLDLIRPLITRRDTNFRRAISAEERLSLTIRYLTTGDSVTTLHQAYLIGRSTVLPVVRDTCRAIFSALREKYLPTPTTKEAWAEIAAGYERRWNLPNVVGSVDGKHIRMKCPPKSGSLYFNYKGYYSVILLGVVDSEYKFVYADVGAEGRASDSRIWKDSAFFRDCTDPTNPLDIPLPGNIVGMAGEMDYFFVGDDAFALDRRLMKPFPSRNLTARQRIFNYRLSRCRRTVENAFGILSTRFRLFRREIDMSPEGVKCAVMAAVVLHNYLREKAPHQYLPKASVDWEDKDFFTHEGMWRREEQLDRIQLDHARNYTAHVKNMRERLADWCVSGIGEVPWQYTLALGE